MLHQPLCDRTRQNARMIAPLFALTFFNPLSTDATQQDDLAALLRQVDQLEYLTDSITKDPDDDNTRYHFDHARLQADMQSIRQGIRDYLSPPRAQPRDPAALSGNYRQEAEVSP